MSNPFYLTIEVGTKSAFQMQPLWKLVYDTQNDTKAQEMCQDLPHKFVTDTVKKRHGRAKITG